MIDKIEIKNFKSIVDLELELGRVNIVVGANGCGKSNILEAIAFASAASLQKLDNEYLLSRGIRVPEPSFMLPAFDDMERPDAIQFTVSQGEHSNPMLVKYQDKQWKEVLASTMVQAVTQLIFQFMKEDYSFKPSTEPNEAIKELNQQEIKGLLFESLKKRGLQNLLDFNLQDQNNQHPVMESFRSFLIFSPQESLLRDQNLESPIKPIGVHGEGLFQFLKEQWKQDNRTLFEQLNEGLALLDWFDEISIPADLLSNEAKLEIGDRFLTDSLNHFDQRSTNEGFLFLLFYLTLFHSKDTPSFFAIDNIESSFNPKLCLHLVKYLIGIAKENDKQVILTTHNPFVLDALDLKDDEQRLFVARRDIDGHTRISRIEHKPERAEKLSSVWMNGYIGGLPDNF